MTDQNIVFKNSKTGKVEQIPANEIELVNFQKFIGSWGLRLFLKNGTLHRYGGFKDGVSLLSIKLKLERENYSFYHFYILRPTWSD